MVYHSEEFWDDRAQSEQQDGNVHVDWGCSYNTLLPLLQPIIKRPRCAALVVGTGISDFPERLYDAGIKEVWLVERSHVAASAVASRNADGGRRGLRVLESDLLGLKLVTPPRVAAMVTQKLQAEREKQEAQEAASRAAKAKGAGVAAADGKGHAGEPGAHATAPANIMEDSVAKAADAGGVGETGTEAADDEGRPPPASLSSEARAQILAVAHQPAGSVTEQSLKTGSMDLVVDKGTLDCILCERGGYPKAVQALKTMHEVLKTPGTLVLTSHSGPWDRLELLQSVAWHDIKVRQVSTPTFEQLGHTSYHERLEELAETPGKPFMPGTSYVYELTR